MIYARFRDNISAQDGNELKRKIFSGKRHIIVRASNRRICHAHCGNIDANKARKKMSNKVSALRSFISFSLITTVLFSFLPVMAQGPDLVPISDITGGSSVFVLRNTGRSSRKFSTAKTTRSKSQRLETAKKIKKQFDTINRATPLRVRAAVVDPNKMPTNIKTMASDKASVLFAGVGEYYIDKNDLENSLKFFRESVGLDDKNMKAKQGLSEALAAKGNELLVADKATTAKAYFLEAVKIDPKNSAAYFGLGEVYTELDQSKEAIKNFEDALANNPKLTEIFVPLGILYFQAGEIAKADDMLTRALTNSTEAAETQIFLGSIRMSQNRKQEALAAFQRAKAIDPTNADSYFQIGETLVRLDRETEAVEEFKQAVALKPMFFEAWVSLADVYYEIKNYPEAVKAYSQAKRIKNDNVEVLVGLGDAQRMSSDFNGAAGSYNLAATFITRNPNFDKNEAADIYSKIGYVIGQQCQINMRQAKPCAWPQAIRALEKSVEYGSGNTADFANLGWAYYNAARVDGYEKRESDKQTKLALAKAMLEKAVAANPAYIEGPWLNLGMALTDMGDYQGAVTVLTKVVNKQPKWVFALNELGIAYRQQKNYKEAINYFKKAVDRDDNFAAAYYNLGETEYRNGNTPNAKKAYERLVKLGRSDLAAQLDLISNGAVRK